MVFSNINYIAIFIAAIAGFLIGGLWYSSLLFGKQWIKYNPTPIEHLQAHARSAYIVTFLGNIITAYVIAVFINTLQVKTITEILLFGFLVWLGFIGTVTLSDTMFTNKPIQQWLIDTSYRLVSTLVMVSIICFWHP